MHILIVDDEIKIREVVREYAEASGYKSDEASDGYQAIEKVKNNATIFLRKVVVLC